MPRTRRWREGAPLFIEDPAMIAVNGYARDNSSEDKRDDLLQIGSGFYVLHPCLQLHLLCSSQGAKSLWLDSKTTKCTRHRSISSFLEATSFQKFKPTFLGTIIDDPTRAILPAVLALSRICGTEGLFRLPFISFPHCERLYPTYVSLITSTSFERDNRSVEIFQSQSRIREIQGKVQSGYLRTAVEFQLHECISQSEKQCTGCKHYSDANLVARCRGCNFGSGKSGNSIFHVRISHVVDVGHARWIYQCAARLQPELGNQAARPIWYEYPVTGSNRSCR